VVVQAALLGGLDELRDALGALHAPGQGLDALAGIFGFVYSFFRVRGRKIKV